MGAFYRAKVAEFLTEAVSAVVGQLSVAYAHSGFSSQRTDQTLVWEDDLRRLQRTLTEVCRTRPLAANWSVLLEFEIPRKEKRIDIVLLAGGKIVVLEAKAHKASAMDCQQAQEYALLLHYFHASSRRRVITPIVVTPLDGRFSPDGQGEFAFEETASFWVRQVQRVGWDWLADMLVDLGDGDALEVVDWEAGEYRPVPTIIRAALELQSGLNVREIAHSGAARHEVEALTAFVRDRVLEASEAKRHVICFVTGVPGSGKTLVGLSLAFSEQVHGEPIHFMSGNGPLVKVLQAVLARHRRGHGVRVLDAKIHAKTLIENVHVFAREYTDRSANDAPSNRVVIFDEAQRAWNRDQNKLKFGRDYSEPEMLLHIMERHEDWAVVIALVGGGQEINNGEAGLAEWGRALAKTTRRTWAVYASGEAMDGGTSVAGSRLNEQASELRITQEAQLHLDVSLRSLTADSYARWVNAVLEGDVHAAAGIREDMKFPIFLVRDLDQARKILRLHTRGESRCGLVGSSQAARLRAEGLEPDANFHGNYPWEHWYLGEAADIRSSFQMEVFATEFEIQGLELDWIGLCWGGDFVWSAQRSAWMLRSFRAANSRWSEIKATEKQVYRRNAYRVLLTRARQGMVLYVPKGSDTDETRSSFEFDETASFLLKCGAREID